jgi:hypothetical protein
MTRVSEDIIGVVIAPFINDYSALMIVLSLSETICSYAISVGVKPLDLLPKNKYMCEIKVRKLLKGSKVHTIENGPIILRDAEYMFLFPNKSIKSVYIHTPRSKMEIHLTIEKRITECPFYDDSIRYERGSIYNGIFNREIYFHLSRLDRERYTFYPYGINNKCFV